MFTSSHSVISSSSLRWLILICVLLSRSLVAQAGCYNPDGSNRNGDGALGGAYAPCAAQPWQTDGHSMCCRSNQTAGDSCLPNGLCNSTYGDWIIWRESCTDPTWKSPSCVKMYISGLYDNGIVTSSADGGSAVNSTDQPLLQCPDGSWCLNPVQDGSIRNGSTLACCSKKEGFFENNGVVKADSVSTSTSSTHSTATHSPTNTASSGRVSSVPSLGDSNAPSGTSAGVIAGATVGAVVGVTVLAGAVWLLLRKRSRRQTPHGSAAPQVVDKFGGSGGGDVGYYAPGKATHPLAQGQFGASELPDRVSELPISHPRYELGTGH